MSKQRRQAPKKVQQARRSTASRRGMDSPMGPSTKKDIKVNKNGGARSKARMGAVKRSNGRKGSQKSIGRSMRTGM